MGMRKPAGKPVHPCTLLYFSSKLQLFLFFIFLYFIFLTSLLGYNCFTMVCQFLLYNKVNQLYIYIYPHIFSLLPLPPTLPIPALPVLRNCFPLVICLTFGSVYMSMPLSHYVPSYPSPSPCPQVHSLCLRLYSCPAPRFCRNFFFFNIPYICVNMWYLFFSF